MNSVVFDQLRISEDGKVFFIDIHVDTASYYERLYLDTITLVTSDHVLTTDPYSPTEDFIYKATFDDNQKQATIELQKADIDRAFLNVDSEGNPIDPEAPYGKIPFNSKDFSRDLFFVYVECKGYISPDAPCGDDNLTSVGVTFDETMFHQKVMDYTRELAQNCQIPEGFMDMILLWYGFQSAIETEHYLPAIEFWNKMFRSKGSRTFGITKGCGCHG